MLNRNLVAFARTCKQWVQHLLTKLRRSSPLVGMLFGRTVVQGPEQEKPPAADVTSSLNSFAGQRDQLVEFMKSSYKDDPAFRAQLDAEFATLSAAEKKDLSRPLEFEDKTAVTLDIMGTDPYIQAAQELKDKEKVKLVIFGHTHTAGAFSEKRSFLPQFRLLATNRASR